MQRRIQTPNSGQGDIFAGKAPEYPTKDEVVEAAAGMAVIDAFRQAETSHRETGQTRAEGLEKQGEGETVQAIAKGEITANQRPDISADKERVAQRQKDLAQGKRGVRNEKGTISRSELGSRQKITGDEPSDAEIELARQRRQSLNDPDNENPLDNAVLSA